MKTLAVSILALTMPAAAIAPAMAQDWTQDPLDAYMKVAAGFEPNPYSFDVYARGEFKPSIKDRGGEGCKGAVVSAPSVDIYFQRRSLIAAADDRGEIER